MKKIVTIVLVLVMIFGLSTVSLAAPSSGFHPVSVSLSNGTLTVVGWIYNAGDTTLGNICSFKLKVYDKNDNFVTQATFNDGNLQGIKLLPGEGIKWKFNITNVTTYADLSEWSCEWSFDSKNYDSYNLGNGVKVYYNGERIDFDVPPSLINNRTMVPMRAIFEKMGATVEWDSATKTVTATRGNTSIKLTINDTTAYVNGQAVTLDSPAILVNGRTLVPVRFIGEAFGCVVVWGGTDKIVGIYE